MNANSFFRLIGEAGGKRDTVVCCRLQIAPVGIGDGLYQNDLICAGAVDRGIGDGVTDFQILDAADGVLGAPVMAAPRRYCRPTLRWSCNAPVPFSCFLLFLLPRPSC